MITCVSYKHSLIPLNLNENHYALTISFGASQATFKLEKLSSIHIKAVTHFLEDISFWSYFLKKMNGIATNNHIDISSILINTFVESLPPSTFTTTNSGVKMPLGLVFLIKKTIGFVVDK